MGIELLKAFKIDDLVLMAPDIDVEIAEQQTRVVNANRDMIGHA